jgi:hypothetical protein
VPIVAFKRADLSCGPAVRTFLSSGTTEGFANRSRHLIPDLRLYQHSASAGLRQFLFPDVARMRLISLIQSVDDLPQSSLAQMVAWAMADFGEADSLYAVTADGIDFTVLTDALRQSEHDGRPLCLMTTTGALVRVFDHFRTLAIVSPAAQQPADGHRRHQGFAASPVRNGVLHAAWSAFAIPGYFCVNEYGMAELSSQFTTASSPTASVADTVHGASSDRTGRARWCSISRRWRRSPAMHRVSSAISISPTLEAPWPS